MPVDKHDYDEIRRFGQTFTVVVNDVIEVLSADALGVYVHLLSKPSDWVIRPTEVKRRFSIGDYTWRRIAKELRDAGVLFDQWEKDEKGQLTKRVLYLGSQPIDSLPLNSNDKEPLPLIIHDEGDPRRGKPTPLQSIDLLQSKELIQKAFESFWSATSGEFGAKGSKSKCLTQFKRLDPSVRESLKEIYQDQLAEKRAIKDSGEFCPNFPHLERWIRDGRYEDESSAPQEDSVWGLVQ